MAPMSDCDEREVVVKFKFVHVRATFDGSNSVEGMVGAGFV